MQPVGGRGDAVQPIQMVPTFSFVDTPPLEVTSARRSFPLMHHNIFRKSTIFKCLDDFLMVTFVYIYGKKIKHGMIGMTSLLFRLCRPVERYFLFRFLPSAPIDERLNMFHKDEHQNDDVFE